MTIRCRHSILEPKKIDDYRTELICIRCYEIVGVWENVKVEGVARKYNDDEIDMFK